MSQRKIYSRNGKIFMGGIGFAYNFHLLKNRYVFLNYPLKLQCDDDDDKVEYSRY